MSAVASTAFAVALADLGGFQVALAMGARLGWFAWGGQHDRLPRHFRLGDVLAVPLYAVVLQRVGVLLVRPAGAWIGAVTWAIVGWLGSSVGLSAASRSRSERLVMPPLAALLLGLSLIVAPSS